MNKSDKFYFNLPKYNNIPNVGLYLEQVVKYVNDIIEPFDVSITSSMVSNYVKKGYIERPVKKQYFAEQIAYIVFIALAKQVLSMENIASLISLQKETYPLDISYNLFCTELEEVLDNLLNEKKEISSLPANSTFAKKTLRSVVIALSHIIYLNYYFKSKEHAK